MKRAFAPRKIGPIKGKGLGQSKMGPGSFVVPPPSMEQYYKMMANILKSKYEMLRGIV